MNQTDQPIPSTDRLAPLYRLSQGFNSSLDLDRVLELVTDESIGVMQAERGFGMLLEEGQGQELAPTIQLIERTDSQVVPMITYPRYAEILLRAGGEEQALGRVRTAIAIAQAAPSEHFEAVGRLVLSQILDAQGQKEMAA